MGGPYNQFPSIYTGGGPLHIINSPPYIREGNGGGRGTPPFPSIHTGGGGGGEPLHIINSPPYTGGEWEPLHLWEGNGGAHHINSGRGGELYGFQVVFTLEHTVISIVR